MPVYEYQCTACRHHLEALQKPDEGAITKCPECGEDKLQKLISAPAFHLKGTGWYATDFKDKKPVKPSSETPDSKTEPLKENDKAKPEAVEKEVTESKESAPPTRTKKADKAD